MAVQVSVNVYQIENRVMDRNEPIRTSFPTAGIIVTDASQTSTRSLPSGYNVYACITVPSSAAANSQGTRYWVAETVAQLATMMAV